MNYPFLQARNYTPAARKGVDLVVLHSAETQERPGVAWSVAKWFAGETAPRASAHYVLDDTTTIQCVHEADIAWHAPGANYNGIGIEHAGRAAQSREDWSDAYSRAVLARSIDLATEICLRWGIPAVVVDVAGLQRGVRGVTTHAAVSKAFAKSTHQDPGEGFPLSWYVEQVAARIRGAA